MSLGVDDYLGWSPAEMSGAASWLSGTSKDMELSAKALRNAAADGTAGQCGPFIDARRTEAAGIADRVHELSELLRDSARLVEDAGTDLATLVGLLRDECRVIDEEGFERFDGTGVRNTRTEYAAEDERDRRQRRAEELQDQLRGHLKEIRLRDDQADRALHGLVDRSVRDRTRAGNGDPFVVGLSETTLIGGVTRAAAALAEGHWQEAAREAGRGLVTVRALGPVASLLGFAGGVAGRPEDEPLFEAIVAEGVGSVAAAGGIPLGMAIGGALAGPPGSVIGAGSGAGSSMFGGQWTASRVRAWFDSEN